MSVEYSVQVSLCKTTKLLRTPYCVQYYTTPQPPTAQTTFHILIPLVFNIFVCTAVDPYPWLWLAAGTLYNTIGTGLASQSLLVAAPNPRNEALAPPDLP
jgi:hypothetical protein